MKSASIGQHLDEGEQSMMRRRWEEEEMVVERVELREHVGADENWDDERECVMGKGEVFSIGGECALEEKPGQVRIVGVSEESFGHHFCLFHCSARSLNSYFIKLIKIAKFAEQATKTIKHLSIHLNHNFDVQLQIQLLQFLMSNFLKLYLYNTTRLFIILKLQFVQLIMIDKIN